MREASWAPEAHESTCTGLGNGNGVEDGKEKRNFDIFEGNLVKSSAAMDTVCFSKRLTGKSFISYCQTGQEKSSSDSNILHASGV